ncbi:MAG: ATP-binding protein [Actinomycetota bacterium]
MAQTRVPTRVLIADDKPEIRSVMRRLVETDRRFKVVGETSTGLETIERLDTSRPDAVVLDLDLPDMDGLEILSVILQRAPHLKVVVMAGPESTTRADEAIRLGADDFIDKASSLHDLQTRLMALFSGASESLDAAVGDDPPGPPPPEASIDDVLSVLIHELQAPLAVVEAFTISLAGAVERDDGAAIQDTSAAIKRATGTLRSLIRSFSEVRDLDAGRLKLNLREVELGKQAELTVGDLAHVARTHTVKLDVAEELVVLLDPVRVRQVITNLVVNAAKFSPQNTLIRIGVRSDDDFAHVAVTDRGPGIPPGRSGELFRRFSRLGATGSGTGLGLYLSRGIALSHGGDLTCESSPGRGSTFTLALPLGGPPIPPEQGTLT